ncbi:nicotinamide-nucleotide amidohydrolase family protein [Bombilactobacillus bombi]|uniref:nicotinamide-nucleotide amidohydrolase family protein n=1 Tax=Bombilactobacillus bombi TaxID=1303590 RepID=UPI0015E5A5B6|nr:nicotinamide-nucleotide amidohydrolase family protein [Bombilactobacillus bombi]
MQKLRQQFQTAQADTVAFTLASYQELFAEVVKILHQKQQTITASESLTAGLFQATLATIPGASNVFTGGFVTYSMAMKSQLLEIPFNKLQEHGVVSSWTAKQMSVQSAKIIDTDWGVGLTGVAGPAALEDQPAGTVWIAVKNPANQVTAQQFKFAGQRADIRQKSVVAAFFMIANQL